MLFNVIQSYSTIYQNICGFLWQFQLFLVPLHHQTCFTKNQSSCKRHQAKKTAVRVIICPLDPKGRLPQQELSTVRSTHRGACYRKGRKNCQLTHWEEQSLQLAISPTFNHKQPGRNSVLCLLQIRHFRTSQHCVDGRFFRQK